MGPPAAPRALLIRADHLGDAILTTPVARALAKGGYRVDLLVPGAFVPLLAGLPFLDHCQGLEEAAPGWRKRPWRLASWIRSRGYTAVILPHAQPWALPVASLLSGAPRRIAMWGGVWGRLTGHQCLRSGLTTHPRHYADIALDCARALGVADDGLRPEIAFRNDGGTPVPGRRRVGIHPGCAGNTCNLAPAAYGELAALILKETDWEIVVTGVASEAPLLASWAPEVVASPRVRNTMGRLSLPELAAMLPTLDLLVVPGTGPLHVAAALGVATLTPFCARSAHSHVVWGNLANGRHEETTPAQCADRPLGTLCDFSGKISPRRLFERCREILHDPAPTP